MGKGAYREPSHVPIILQLHGTTQTGATTLNCVSNNTSFANNVMNISHMVWQDTMTLRLTIAASHKKLTQGAAGELLWNGLEVQLRQNALQ